MILVDLIVCPERLQLVAFVDMTAPTAEKGMTVFDLLSQWRPADD